MTRYFILHVLTGQLFCFKEPGTGRALWTDQKDSAQGYSSAEEAEKIRSTFGALNYVTSKVISGDDFQEPIIIKVKS
jgi:hypothetical protein